MGKCVCCGKKATDIIYDTRPGCEGWFLNCAEHVDTRTDLIVPRHLIEQLIEDY